LYDVKRSADALDAQAYRTEDGVLHRKLIGLYMNYSVSVGIENDLDLYDSLFDKLTEPVEYHEIKLPNESVAQTRYISSVTDGILRVQDNGVIYKDLSFKITCMAPTRKAK
jgi:hypothetical protein